MERNFKITIPEPCHENWDQMTPSEGGRFCMSCSKIVVDFSTMLPDEVQQFFIQNQNKKICGRFKNEQLETLIIQIPSQVLYNQTHYSKMFLLALFIAMGTTLFSCQDKDGKKQKIDKIEVVEDSLPHQNIPEEAVAVKEKDSKLSPPLPHIIKIDPQKDPEIFYPMLIGEPALVDYGDNSNQNSIDYDAIFNTASLDILPVQDVGIKEYNAFLNNNFVLPKKFEQQTGKIYVSFVIEKDGSLSTFTISGNFGKEIEEEAIRVLKMAPKWTPGKLNNHAVRTLYNLPFSFKQ